MSLDRPYVIGVAGGSGSGKTTVIRKLVQSAGTENTSVIQHDWYYKDHSHLDLEDRAKLNYDHPHSLETSLLISNLKELITGRSVTCPRYDFSNHKRETESQLVQSREIIIVDGILIFRDEELRDLMDIKVFVDTDCDLRFIRRLSRDMSERGRSLESVIDQYLTTVKPMHDLFVETSKRYADIIIPRGGENSAAINLLIAQVESILNRKEGRHTQLNYTQWDHQKDGCIVCKPPES